MVEMSFLRPARSSSVASSVASEHRTRRRGADSPKKPSPSELLKEIGIAGPEVVKILKARGWEVRESSIKDLDSRERYYLPGGKAKGDDAEHFEDFLMGVGELYAYVLERGGKNYLIPNADQTLASYTMQRDSSVRDNSAPRTSATFTEVAPGEACSRRDSVVFESGEDTDNIEYVSEEGDNSHSRQRRRKKLKTSEHSETEVGQARNDVIVVDDSHDTDSPPPRARCTTEEQETPQPRTRPDRRTEVEKYEAALKLRGATAQLLKGVDLNLLRSVAQVAYRVSKLVRDNEQNFSELERFAERIQVARNCFSSAIAGIVELDTSLFGSSANESGIELPSFISSGQGRLPLVQDIERYVLLACQVLRPLTYSACGTRSGDVTDLRPLQQHIDTTSKELVDLAMKICGKDKRNIRDSRGRH